MASPDNISRSVLALDFGRRRIGIATGSSITGTASALTTISADNGTPDWDELRALTSEWQPDLLVLGLPYNSDGSESEMTAEVKRFATELEAQCQLPIEFVDERFTSAEAETILREQRRQGLRQKKVKKEDVDATAAQLIAESWMRNTGAGSPS